MSIPLFAVINYLLCDTLSIHLMIKNKQYKKNINANVCQSPFPLKGYSCLHLLFMDTNLKALKQIDQINIYISLFVLIVQFHRLHKHIII